MEDTFRQTYRELTDVDRNAMTVIKDHAAKLEALIKALGTSRELSLAMTNLEQSVMWAAKHITK